MPGGAAVGDDTEETDLPFREVAQHLPALCWISDAGGQIIWANDAWVDYTGMTPETTRAEGLQPLHDPAIYGEVVERWERAKAEGLPAEMRFPLRSRDGDFRPFLTKVTPIKDRRGRITRWFGVNTDVSAQAEAERAQRGAETRFRELFERAGEAILVLEPDGRVAQANEAAAALLGADRRSLIGAPLVRRCIDAPAEGSAASPPLDEWRIQRADGGFIDVEANIAELSDGCRLAILRDISARRRAEDLMAVEHAELRLQVGEETARAAGATRQLERFWDASRDLLAIISVADGKPRMLNAAAWAATLGYSAEVLMNTRLVELVHPEDRDHTLALKQSLSENRTVYGFENRYRHQDGHWVWLSWNVVRDDGLDYAIARDISEEILAKHALAQSERQFRLLVAGVVDYALFMLNPDGIVTNWNSGAQRIKGYTADEILGRHFSIFYTEPDRASGLPARALQTARTEGRYEAESWRVRKNGELFWANVVIDPIRDEEGGLIGYAKITRDMTERRNAQLELQRAQERLAQAQKLEAIGQLTGGVAHDFNNILMVVGGQTELLRRKLGDADPAYARSLEAIELSAQRGQALTRHLLAFARRQRLNPEPLDLASRAETLQQLLATGVGSSINVRVNFPSDLWHVEVDASEFELALLNMAVNARDAMPNGGRITLEARNDATDEGEPAAEAGGDFVALTMTDTGSGIAPDILAKVFEPFFTTKDVDKGTGLGLSQVYGFVQQSGGRISIDSELGSGTSITIHLPRAGGEPALGQTAEVLLVEDNPQVAEVALSLLDQLGYRTRVAGNAAAALDILEREDRPDIVVSDVVMAGPQNGLDLAREVRRRWPEVGVLLATGYSESTEKMPKGEFPILAKPYGLSELSRAISALRPGPAQDKSGAPLLPSAP